MSSTTTQTLDHTTHNEKVTSAIGNDSNLQFTQTNDPIIQDRSHHNNDQTSHDQQTIRRKLVVVGDGACGKTSLLVAYKDDRFDNDYVPTVFENTHAAVPVENRTVDLALWDTAGTFPFQTSLMKSYRTGRLRSSETTQLSRQQRHSHLLCHRQPRKSIKRTAEMDPRTAEILSNCSHSARGMQIRSPPISQRLPLSISNRLYHVFSLHQHHHVD